MMATATGKVYQSLVQRYFTSFYFMGNVFKFFKMEIIGKWRPPAWITLVMLTTCISSSAHAGKYVCYAKNNVKNNDVMGKKGEDQTVLQHSNKICLVTIARSHKLCKEGRISSISFQAKNRKNRADNKVSGKGKRGAQQLEHNSLLCEIELENGTKFVLRSCISGKLVEVNEELLENPNLLLERGPRHEFRSAWALCLTTSNGDDGDRGKIRSGVVMKRVQNYHRENEDTSLHKPATQEQIMEENGGYIAIVLPKLLPFEKITKNMLTEEEYHEALTRRTTTPEVT